MNVNKGAIAEQKNALRRKIKAKKQLYSDAERFDKSTTIFEKVEQSEAFIQARVVLVYWSMPDEVYTHNFIQKWAIKKTILLPVVDGDNLRIKAFTGIENMQPGSLMEIPEPVGPDYTNPESIDLIIVPGVAFDSQNYRLGRGCGFYDRLLNHNQVKKMGVCFDFQMVAEVPKENHDIPMDFVIYA